MGIYDQNMNIHNIILIIMIWSKENFSCLQRKGKVHQKPSKFDRNIQIGESVYDRKETPNHTRTFKNIWKPIYVSNQIVQDFPYQQNSDESDVITIDNIHNYQDTPRANLNMNKILRATMTVDNIR